MTTKKHPDRHYHHILVDGTEDDYYSEILHSHNGGRKGHVHQVEMSAAYKKVNREIGAR